MSSEREWTDLLRSLQTAVVDAQTAASTLAAADTIEENGEQEEVVDENVLRLQDQVKAAFTSLNHKLVELHSRLKSVEDDIELGMPSGSTTPQQNANNVEAAAVEAVEVPMNNEEEEVDEGCEDYSPSSPPAPVVGVQGTTSITPSIAEEMVLQCRAVLRMSAVPSARRRRLQNDKHLKDIELENRCFALTAQLLAELGKGHSGRGLCLKHDIINAIEVVLQKIVSYDDKRETAERKRRESVEEGATPEQLENELELEKNFDRRNTGAVEAVVQICRILGNLCYECNEGRDQIMQTNCMKHIHSLAKNRERIKKEDPGQRFPVITAGFLLNFCNENVDAVRLAGETGFVGVAVANILDTKTNDAVYNSSLNFLVIIAEAEDGREYLKTCPLFFKALNHILVNTTSPDVTETSMELIRSIVEFEDLTLDMVKEGVMCTFLDKIAGKWRSPEFDDQRANACDLIVLVLSHDESMKYLYSIEEGKYVNVFRSWLTLEEPNQQLQIASSLAIGNFARNEENCLKLVQDGTSAELIDVLRRHQNVFTDLKIQSAILGALKNLSVSPKSRKSLLEQGILDPTVSLIGELPHMAAHSVIFKLLGVLRLIVDGSPEAAGRLGLNAVTMAAVSDYGNIDVPGVRSEASRILAAIVKNAKAGDERAQICRNIANQAAMPHLTGMLHSQHTRMINEALIALNIFSASGVEHETVRAQLHTDLVINGVKRILELPDMKPEQEGSMNYVLNRGGNNSIPVEIKQNALKFIVMLTRVDDSEKGFIQMLKDLEFSDCLKNLSESLKHDESFKDLEAKVN